MKRKIAFFTDLDRTLIYSSKFLDEFIESVCVEKSGEKEISFMTKKSLSLLYTVQQKVSFIPVSTRTYSQMTRIDFIRNSLPEWMVCDNGAHIYYHGKLWEEWEELIQSKTKRLKISQNELKGLMIETFQEQGLKEIVHHSLYLIMKFQEMTGEIRGMLEVLSLSLRPLGFYIETNSNKAYILPLDVRKEKAVNYLMRKNKYDYTISAGDSRMDMGMLELTDKAIAPYHRTFKKDTIKLTKVFGIRAGEEILVNIMSILSKQNM